tara:strand:- start:2520 stop:2861 length:342 start_codon:yes stop_codon:yes gene_type:complete
MTLGEKQREFTLNISKLITFAYEQGYALTVGDAYRDPRSHGEWSARIAYGRRHSLHKRRLAMDFNLFIDGVYQTTTEAHKPLGEYWELLHEDNSWGGRFNDGNHYSMAYGRFR